VTDDEPKTNWWQTPLWSGLAIAAFSISVSALLSWGIASCTAQDQIEQAREDQKIELAQAAKDGADVALDRVEKMLNALPPKRRATVEPLLSSGNARYKAGRSLFAEKKWEDARAAFEEATEQFSAVCSTIRGTLCLPKA
jgi:hypothetical protein